MDGDQLQSALIELKYAVRSLVIQFLPPDPIRIPETLTQLSGCIQAGGDANQILTTITEDLSTRLPHGGRLRAVKAVLTSSMDPVAHPWANTLKLVSDEWATWGTPWLLAAEHECKQGDYQLARQYLTSAHRLMPVAKTHFRAIVDQYRRAVRTKKAYRDHELFATSLIATHAPSLGNFALWMECAHKLKGPSALQAIRDYCLSLHGPEPEKWDVLEQYDDLSAAGSLCGLVNRVAAHERQGRDFRAHDFHFWNRAAINYLTRSLKASRKPGEEDEDSRDSKKYHAAIRLGEAYANTLQFLRSYGDQEEHQRFLDEARAFILELGRSRTSVAYIAQRQLVAISVGEARRAQNVQRPQAEIDALVDQAHEDFANLYHFTFPSQRPKVAQWHMEFLFECARLEQVEAVAKATDAPDIAEVAVKYRRKHHKEAIKQLMSMLDLRLRGDQALGYGKLLFHYLEQIEGRDVRLPDGVRARARACLQRLLPLLISKCNEELKEGDIAQAQIYLRAAQYAELDPLAANLVHLAARIGQAEILEGRSPDTVLSDLTAAFHERPALRHEPFCRGIFLEILASESVVSVVDPTLVWAMAMETTGLPNQQYDAYNLTHALVWQIRSGQFNDWADRVLFAARTFPDNGFIQRLPVRLWTERGLDAVPVLLELLAKASSRADLIAQDQEPWVVKAFGFMPGAFFFTDSVPEIFARWLTSQTQGNLETIWSRRSIARMFIEGLVKGQLEVWGELPLCQERTSFVVSWISRYLPVEFMPDRWAQWLGSQRGQCEQAIVRRLSTRLAQLRGDLIDSGDQRRQTWLQHLTEFFRELLGPRSGVDEEGSLPAGGEDVLRFCMDAAARFQWAAPDSDYWRDLNALVEWWQPTIPLEELPRVMERAWMQLHRRMEGIIAQRIIEVALPALHDFKAHISKSLDSVTIPPEWVDRFQRILDQTMQHLHWYRWRAPILLDLRTVLEEVAYRPPFTSIHRGEKQQTPRLWAIRPPQPVMVNGDRELLTEVVRSLLENARRHTPRKDHGGWIWAEIRQEHGWAVLEVTDHGGDGVSSAIVERLNARMGKPFSGAQSTGYGTRLCHRVMGLHQGSIRFRPAGLGLTVEVRLPLADVGDEGDGETEFSSSDIDR